MSFEWLTPAEANAGVRVILADGTVMAAPDRRELANRIGLTTVPALDEYDTVIIGGGPAGLAAAVYGASEGMRTLMVEHEAPGGQAGTSSRIENYLGFPTGVSGDELARRALAQAKRFGAEILVTRKVERLDAPSREIFLSGGESVRARTIILATGVSWRTLELPDVERLSGRGIYYGAARSEASSLGGLDVFLIGAGNSAGQAAMYFSGYARSVTLVVRGDSLAKSMSHYLIAQLQSRANVIVRLNAQVNAVYGDDHLDAIDISSNGVIERHDAGALYIFIGANAETNWLPGEIERDGLGYVMTGDDVRYRSIKRVAAGVGEGSMAIAFVHQFLQAS